MIGFFKEAFSNGNFTWGLFVGWFCGFMIALGFVMILIRIFILPEILTWLQFSV